MRKGIRITTEFLPISENLQDGTESRRTRSENDDYVTLAQQRTTLMPLAFWHGPAVDHRRLEPQKKAPAGSRKRKDTLAKYGSPVPPSHRDLQSPVQSAQRCFFPRFPFDAVKKGVGFLRKTKGWLGSNASHLY